MGATLLEKIDFLKQPEIANKKTAWLLGGGGAAGINQVGFLDALIGDCRWTNVCASFGVSTGTLQAAWLAQGPQYIDGLVNVWKGIKSERDIYKKVVLGSGFLSWVRCLLGGASAHSLKPLQKLLERYLDLDVIKNSGILFMAGIVDYNNKRYIQCEPLKMVEPIKAILASCSIPGTFAGYNFKRNGMHHWCFDGGVMDVVPQVDEAIAAGAERIVYCLCRGPLQPDNVKYSDAIKILKETLNLTIADGISDDIELARRDVVRVNEMVGHKVPGYENKRKIDFIVIRPSVTRENVDSLEFDPDKFRRILRVAPHEAIGQAYDLYYGKD